MKQSYYRMGLCSGVAITALLVGTSSCSGSSNKSVIATASNPAALAVTATSINRLDAAGQIAGRQINLVWTNLPSNAARVTLTRTGGTDKQVALTGMTNTYADTEVTVDTSYNYTVTVYDTGGSTIASGSSQGIKVGLPVAAGAPVLISPLPDANVPPTETVQLKWTVPNPVPNFIYIQVSSTLANKLIAAIVVNGTETEARIQTQRIAAPRTVSIIDSDAIIPNLVDVLPINTRGTLTEDLPFQATVTSVYSDQATLASSRAVTTRAGTPVTFKLPTPSSYFMGS